MTDPLIVDFKTVNEIFKILEKKFIKKYEWKIQDLNAYLFTLTSACTIATCKDKNDLEYMLNELTLTFREAFKKTSEMHED